MFGQQVMLFRWHACLSYVLTQRCYFQDSQTSHLCEGTANQIRLFITDVFEHFQLIIYNLHQVKPASHLLSLKAASAVITIRILTLGMGVPQIYQNFLITDSFQYIQLSSVVTQTFCCLHLIISNTKVISLPPGKYLLPKLIFINSSSWIHSCLLSLTSIKGFSYLRLWSLRNTIEKYSSEMLLRNIFEKIHQYLLRNTVV